VDAGVWVAIGTGVPSAVVAILAYRRSVRNDDREWERQIRQDERDRRDQLDRGIREAVDLALDRERARRVRGEDVAE
jgi:hypothetical protein